MTSERTDAPTSGVDELTQQSGLRRRVWRRPTVWLAAVVVLGTGVALLVGTAGGSKPVNTSGWVAVVDGVADFSARLPTQPVDQPVLNATLGPTAITEHIAVVSKAGESVIIAAADASTPIPADAGTAEMRSAIFSFAGTSGLSLKSQGQTTFHGYPAWQGRLKAPNGANVTAVAFAYSNTRVYIVATSSRIFHAVTATFDPRP